MARSGNGKEAIGMEVYEIIENYSKKRAHCVVVTSGAMSFVATH